MVDMFVILMGGLDGGIVVIDLLGDVLFELGLIVFDDDFLGSFELVFDFDDDVL